MSTIEITYDGIDISRSVIFESVSFESQLGAVPGSFELTVRDDFQTHDFITGKEVTLSIDGTRYFGGFVTQVVHQLAFPVDNTTVPGSVRTREFLLRGVDYNILFDKRVIYNVDSPTVAPALFSGTTTDLEVLELLFANYIDLSGDGIDVTTYVEEVGDPTPDGTEGAFMNPGDPWRKQMESIAQFTGAIWYIDANKNLHYQALETVTPSWSFSDAPDRVTSFGFRELEYIEDATNVANDALVWGGSEFGSTGVTAQTVFGRATNTGSIATHARWQIAERHFGEVGFFESSGCTVRAKVIVYGDPGAAGDGFDDQNRGLQFPQKNVRLTWFSEQTPTPLTAGSVVDVVLNVFGSPAVALSLPVRSITITFPIPDRAQFEAFLGIQTSDPWSLWKYMRQQQSRIPASTTVSATSDGSTPAPVPGTYVSTAPTPAPDGANKTFATPDRYIAGSLEVFRFINGQLGGLIQRKGIDYNETSPGTGVFTFITAPADSETLWVRYYSAGTITPVTPPAVGSTATFPGSGSSTQAALLALIANMSYDIIEIETGTYHFSEITINVDRTARPLTIRPNVPGTVTFAGDNGTGGGQFYFGLGGVAKYITMQDFIFDGWSMGDTGQIWLGNTSHITLNDFTVRNVTVTGQGPLYTVAAYLSHNAGVSPHNITLNNWTVTGVSQNFGGLQIQSDTDGAASIHAQGWNVDGIAYVIYTSGVTTDFQVSDWTILNSWRPDVPTWSIRFTVDASGTFSNMHATNSGGIQQSIGGMTDGGGNTGLPVNP